MLYYVRIGDFEGVDYSDRQDCVGDTTLESTRCSVASFNSTKRGTSKMEGIYVMAATTVCSMKCKQ